MPPKPNDATTTLSAGIGGDSMDESLVTQSDGATSAKRPRVVLGFDDGRLLDPVVSGGRVAVPVYDAQAQTNSDDILGALLRIEALLTTIANK